MAVLGMAVGLPIALAKTRFVKSFLSEMKANDPWTFVGAASVLGLAALAAGYGPAWRASRVDPCSALLDE